MIFKRPFFFGSVALAFVVVAELAAAQTTRTWNGSANSDWFDPSNWTPVGVPATNDNVNFNGGTITLTAPVGFSGQFNWSGGKLAGKPFTITASGVMNLSGGGSNSVQNALTNA